MTGGKGKWRAGSFTPSQHEYSDSKDAFFAGEYDEEDSPLDRSSSEEEEEVPEEAMLYGNPPPKEDDEAPDSDDSQGYDYKERTKLRSLDRAGL